MTNHKQGTWHKQGRSSDSGEVEITTADHHQMLVLAINAAVRGEARGSGAIPSTGKSALTRHDQTLASMIGTRHDQKTAEKSKLGDSAI